MHARTHEPPRVIYYIYSQCANGMCVCVCVYARTLPVSPWTSANLLKFCDGNEPWSIRCARWDGEEEEPEQHQSLRRAGGQAGDLMSTGERARQDAQGRILLQSRSGILPSGPAPHPGGREWVPICSSARIQSPDAEREDRISVRDCFNRPCT